MKGSIWSKLTSKDNDTSGGLSELLWSLGSSDKNLGETVPQAPQPEPYMDSRPIEPESRKSSLAVTLKWVLFAAVIVYMILSYFRVPLLTKMGQYLIVAHPLEKADLIVCTQGSNPVELGLAAADAYKRGLAPRIFIPRGETPEGNDVLRARGVHYPEQSELFVMLLRGLGVPRDACITSDEPVDSVPMEARLVKKLTISKDYESLIIVAPPLETRYTWLVFKRLFGKTDVKLIMLPTIYTRFRPDSWWHTDKYIGEVLVAYQRLIYTQIKRLWQ